MLTHNIFQLSYTSETHLFRLQLFPLMFNEESAAAVLGVQPYIVRALVDVLVGYSLVVRHPQLSSFSLQPAVSQLGWLR